MQFAFTDSLLLEKTPRNLILGRMSEKLLLSGIQSEL